MRALTNKCDVSVIVLCVYGPSARLPFQVICNVGPELSFVLVPRSLMPDSSSARFGGAGSSVRSNTICVGSVITSGSPHVASDQAVAARLLAVVWTKALSGGVLWAAAFVRIGLREVSASLHVSCRGVTDLID